MGKQSELNAAEFPTFLYDQGDRIGLLKRILKALGSPDQKFKIIHICGTNGKGSTAMMITAILKQMGHRVGLFTSPYIGEIYNGIQIDFKNIPSRIFEEKISVIKKLLRTAAFANVKVSEFEAQFLISMLYFAEQRV
ncbi:bifunctional folylpolyglutamate synthase/dihydrofolate synthase, partial [Lactobacillus delbrueckii subsp. bulgaricus]|nr:bifunctional folylpolyglutamate synthase/dihydrofolate synthase [Lactobacillus delbrueckii subsp. bulgaricus]